MPSQQSGFEPRVRGARRLSRHAVCLAVLTIAGCAAPPHEDTVTVAVAANFLAPLEALEPEFEAATGYDIVVVAGSTGQLYSQIVNGAPFDVLLAGDAERPRLLAEQGRGDPSSRFTYAIGRLALWSRRSDLIAGGALAQLAERDFRWLAIANPAIAPYGAAAKQTLETLGAWPRLQDRLVQGQNIAQTFALIETGNAELGFVALSQALAYDGSAAYVVVPETSHAPIRQDAIVLERAADNPAAREFAAFLQSPAARVIVARYGYFDGDR